MILVLSLAVPVLAGPAGLVPADILSMETPGHFTLSPDGGNLLYIKSVGTDLAPPMDNGTLMYIDVRPATETALSGPGDSVISYALSPDGNTVVYAAQKRTGGPTSLYLIHVHDTKAIPLKNVTDELTAGFACSGPAASSLPGYRTVLPSAAVMLLSQMRCRLR
jgi:hypothetical protein